MVSLKGCRLQLEEPSFTREINKVLYNTKVFKIKCAEDTFNDDTRIKYTMQSCEPINYDAECKVRCYESCRRIMYASSTRSLQAILNSILA
jgi:hypothetical protein